MQGLCLAAGLDGNFSYTHFSKESQHFRVLRCLKACVSNKSNFPERQNNPHGKDWLWPAGRTFETLGLKILTERKHNRGQLGRF